MGQATYQGRPCRHGHSGIRYKSNRECKECKHDRHLAWKKTEPGVLASRKHGRKNYHKHSVRLRKYDLSKEKYQAMLEAQSGRCWICQEISADGAVLCVDHDHKTGKVRGLLCRNCNVGIGCLKDNISLVRKALLYLELHDG